MAIASLKNCTCANGTKHSDGECFSIMEDSINGMCHHGLAIIISPTSLQAVNVNCGTPR